MIIPSNYYLFINIGIILLYVIFIILGYVKGLVYEIISLLYSFLAVVVAWFACPVFANLYPILTLKDLYEEGDVLSKFINLDPILNSIIYFVIIFVVLKIAYILLTLILKSFNKIPVLGSVNKILGGLFGVINATIVTLVFSVFLSLPVFKNGKEVKNNTLFKLVNNYTNIAIDYVGDNIDIQSYTNEIDNIDVDELRQEFKNWLNKNG